MADRDLVSLHCVSGLSGEGDIPASVRAMRKGAVDFLEKTAPKEKLLSAINMP